MYMWECKHIFIYWWYCWKTFQSLFIFYIVCNVWMRFCQHLSCCTGGRHTKQKTLLLFRSLETNLWQSKKIFYFTVYFCASIVVHKKLGSPCHHEYVKENTPTIELLLLGTANSDLLIICYLLYHKFCFNFLLCI